MWERIRLKIFLFFILIETAQIWKHHKIYNKKIKQTYLFKKVALAILGWFPISCKTKILVLLNKSKIIRK